MDNSRDKIIEKVFDKLLRFLNEACDKYKLNEMVIKGFKSYLELYLTINEENSNMTMEDNIFAISYPIHDEHYESIKNFEWSKEKLPINISWLITDNIEIMIGSNVKINFTAFAKSMESNLEDLSKLHGYLYASLSLIDEPRWCSFYRELANKYISTNDNLDFKSIIKATASKAPEISSFVKQLTEQEGIMDSVKRIFNSNDMESALGEVFELVEDDGENSMLNQIKGILPTDLINDIMKESEK